MHFDGNALQRLNHHIQSIISINSEDAIFITNNCTKSWFTFSPLSLLGACVCVSTLSISVVQWGLQIKPKHKRTETKTKCTKCTKSIQQHSTEISRNGKEATSNSATKSHQPNSKPGQAVDTTFCMCRKANFKYVSSIQCCTVIRKIHFACVILQATIAFTARTLFCLSTCKANWSDLKVSDDRQSLWSIDRFNGFEHNESDQFSEIFFAFS